MDHYIIYYFSVWGSSLQNIANCNIHYSAGKRDRGKKKKKKKKKACAKEGPKAPTQARSTEEEAEGLRRLGRTQAPPEKNFLRKLKNLPALLYTIM